VNPNKETTNMETEAKQPRKTDLDNELRIAEHAAKRRREDIVEACRRAVECLERFAADARRHVERAAELDPTRIIALPGEVLSQSAWGAANAATELSSASRMAAEYMNALGVIEGLKGEDR
jgi:hypothetical protein